MKLKRRLLNILIAFFLLANLFVGMSQSFASGIGGSIGSNIRSDNTYLYMTMEDGLKPYLQSGIGSIDGNNKIQGKYCLNITNSNIMIGLGIDNYEWGNGIMPDQWSIKFLVNSIVGLTFIEFKMDSDIGTPWNTFIQEWDFWIWLANNSFYLQDNTENKYFSDMEFQTNCIYTLTLSNIDFKPKTATAWDSTMDVTLSNATASQTKYNVHFGGIIGGGIGIGKIFPFSRFQWATSAFPVQSIIFVDDWTVGTQALIESDAASNVEETSATLNGELINDGSPLQNASQSNHTIKVLYDTQSHPTNYTYYFNDYDINESFINDPNYIIDISDITYSNTKFGELKKEDDYAIPSTDYLDIGNRIDIWNGDSKQYIATFEETGIPSDFYILSWNGTNIALEDTYSLPAPGYGIASWSGGTKRFIAVGHSNGARLSLLSWNGSNIILEDTYTITCSGITDIDIWNSSGKEYMVVAGADSVYLLSWNGTNIALEDTYNVPGTSISVDIFNISGKTLFIVGHSTTPYLTLLSWDGIDITFEDDYILSGSCWGVDIWNDSSITYIAVAHSGSPYFDILSWNGIDLTLKNSYTLNSKGYDVKSWDEKGKRMIAVTSSTNPYFNLLSFDGSNIINIDSYVLPGFARGIGIWKERNGSNIRNYIAVTHEGINGLILLSATTNNTKFLLTNHTGNTTTTPTENISKVEIRAKSYLSSDAYDGKISLQPVFNLINGSYYNIFSDTTASWSDWIDITNDENVLTAWTWSNIASLKCRVIANLTQGTAYVGKVELRISVNATMDYAYNETVAGSYHGNTTDTDTFSKAVSGLIPGTIYYYRTYINTSYTNSSSYYYGDEEYFLTKPEAPTNLKARYESATNINLSWTKGTGANNTRIQRSTSSYPATYSSGTNVYNGTDSYYVDTVSTDTNYFYTAWSFSKWTNHNEYQFSDNNTKCLYIRTIDAISVEENSATLNAYLISNTTNTVRFQYGLTTAYGTNSSNQTLSGIISVSQAITGLTQGKFYHFRAIAINGSVKTFGQDKYFLTKPEAPRNATVKFNTTHINISWTKGTGAIETSIQFSNSGWNPILIPGNTVDTVTTNYKAFKLNTLYGLWFIVTDTTNMYFTLWSIVSGGGIVTESDNNTKCLFIRTGGQNQATYNATNIKATNATVHAYLISNTTNIVRFQYGYTTAYGTNTSNQTLSGVTALSENIIGLTPGRLYHYRSYAENNTDYAIGNDRYFLTKPEAPTNTNYNIINSTTINLSWTKGTGANNTVILRKTTGAPSSYTDGTIVYNGTGTYSKQSIVMGTTYYYRMWSYSKWTVNPTLQQWSDAGVNVSNIGGLAIDVFDEVTCENLTTYSVFITNKNGSQVYSNTSCHNTHIINLSLCPHGDDIQIIINSSGYHQRLYTMDIYTGMLGYLKAYLPPVSSPSDGGGDDGDTTEDCVQRAYTDSKTVTNHTIDATISLTHTLDSMISVELYNDSLYGTYGGWIFVTADNYTYTTTQVIIEHEILDANTTMVRASYYYLYCPGDSLSALYDIQVVESIETSYTKIDQPVEDVFVEVKRYENNTGVYTTVSSLFTDANGHVNIYLMPNVLYKVFISKDGYEDKISDYIPSPPNNYGQTEIKILRIVKIIEYDENPHVPYLMENITWHIYPDSHLFQTPFTIIFHINSSDAQLQWYYMRVWYLDPSNNTWYVLYFSNQTNAYGGDISYTVPNATGRYSAECCFKKTGYDEYCLGMEGSFSWVLQHLKEWMQSVPDVAYFLVLTIICAVVMGFFMMYLGTGIMTGYIGIGIYVLGLLLKPVTLTLDSHGSTISGWAIVTIVAIVYTIGIYLWSRL